MMIRLAQRKTKLLFIIIALSSTAIISAAATWAEEQAQAKVPADRKMHVSRYDEVARGINAPMYAYYAKKIKKKTGITKGICVDIGSGGGYLGLALARITDLDFIFLDISKEMLEMADRHIIEDGLQGHARTLLADVHKILLEDNSVDLAISRGSIPFWKDPALALSEIYRILKPGGRAIVGGGRGTPEIQAKIAAEREKTTGQASDKPKKRKGGLPGNRPPRDYGKIMQQTGITTYTLDRGNDGFWIELWKQQP